MATLKITKKDRFKTYKKALEICENWNDDIFNLGTSHYLCWVIPCIYFNLNSYDENPTIKGKVFVWDCDDAPNLFPEIKEFAAEMDNSSLHIKKKNAARIEFLKTLLNKHENNN